MSKARICAARRRRPRVARHATEMRSDFLSLWRTREPDEIGPDEVAAIRTRLAHVLLHHRLWPEAVRGDAAAAVGIAIDHLHARAPDGPVGDLVMSALVLHACAGNAAAAVVLSHALAILSHKHPNGPALFARAERWARRGPNVGPPHTSRPPRN